MVLGRYFEPSRYLMLLYEFDAKWNFDIRLRAFICIYAV